jgi:HEAT repeat protein
MRRALCICIALITAAGAVYAQDAQKVLDTFRRNFAIASLDVKIQILQDAAAGKTASSMGPLFQQAVDFVIDNGSLVPTDARFNQLAAIGAEQAGNVGFTAARFSVWKLFKITSDTQTLAKAAIALGTLGAGDPEIIADLNHWLDAQNSVFATGKMPDGSVLVSVIQSMGKLGDSSSFPYLFTAMNLGYSDQISSIAKTALLALKGDFGAMLLGVIKERPIGEKKLALQMSAETDKLTSDQKSQVAEYALDVGLHLSSTEAPSKNMLRDIRFAAADSLGAQKYAHATPLLIEHLDTTIGEFDKGLVDRNHLLNALADLGAMGTHEAAVRLTQYLVLINSYTDKGKAYDDLVVLAVLQSLGGLADKVAFDDLMYTQYLNYSATVKKAARAALDKLKW